jgi:integrase
VVCNLRWEWEVRLESGARVQLGRAVDHRIGKGHASGIRLRVLAPEAQDAELPPDRDDEQHGVQSWRKRCGLHGFRVHDLRHTVGMRLREAGVPESTHADVLWHSHAGMTAHYSVAQVVEIREALEKITDEKHANNVSLASIIREAKEVPTKVPTEAKRPEAVLASGR